MAEAPKPSRAAFPLISDLFIDKAYRQVATLTLGITALVLLCSAFPRREPELMLILTAALVCGLKHAQEKFSSAQKVSVTKVPRTSRHPRLREASKVCRKEQSRATPETQARPHPARKEGFRQTAKPIAPLKFVATGWEAEVDELSRKIARTAEVERLVQLIVSKARRAIQLVVPEAEIIGFASGNPMSNKAFAMAVPEIHIVMKASSAVLLRRLESRYTRGGTISYRPDGQKLQKCAIRTCTEQLVAEAGFKFRRSAFVGEDPKVCLLVPPRLGFCAESVAIDLSVNSTTPLRSETIMSECSRQDPRSESLMLLVRRWARDRGIAHTTKGHLSTYAWNLLTVFFLQVAPTSDSSLGPIGEEPLAKREAECSSQKSVAALFEELVAFYSRDFNWQTEGISVRLGRRAPARVSSNSRFIAAEDGSTELRPSIEDPFEVKVDLGSCVTSNSMSRLREEFQRADELCSRGASLKELLELWAPPLVSPPVNDSNH